MWWMIHDGQQLAEQLKYSALPAAVKKAEAILQSVVYNNTNALNNLTNNGVMISLIHEKPIINVNASGGQPRAFALHGSASPGSRCWDEDSGFAADTGGSASGMDLRGFGDNASEFESVDAQGKRAGAKDSGTDKAPGASRSLNGSGAAGIGSSLRAVTFRVWAESGSMGRPDISGPLKAPVWDSAESSTGSVVDAPVRLSAETGRVFVSSSAQRRGQAVSSDFKKNFSL
jgi:hypothetical protein